MKKTLTRITSILLALILTAFLSACGADAPASDVSPSDSPSDISADAGPSDTSSADVSPSDESSAEASPSDESSAEVSDDAQASPSDENAAASPSDDNADESAEVSPSASNSDDNSGDPSNDNSDTSDDTASTDTSDNSSSDYPKVTPDKTEVSVNGAVNFKVTTSEKVNKIQEMVDGVANKTYTSYTKGTGVRNWTSKIVFKKSGTRKVQFKCTMASGSIVLIPSTSLKIDVGDTSTSSGTYTASASTKSISNNQTVTFTLKTPSSITSVYSVVDDVKQSTVSTSSSESNGVKTWKVKITFHKTGSRSVQFKASEDSTVKKTFPSSAITITVK